jgi:hypothetical protein
MDLHKLTGYIQQYKRYFPEINKEEIYKWRAVKCFQDNWDIAASDFPVMLDRSLSAAQNLLASGTYYPKRMLVDTAIREPERVRELFVNLFNENLSVNGRIIAFQDAFRALCEIHFEGKHPYQDSRAVLVYLSLKYPENYFFYKFEMFKQFAELSGYDVLIKRGGASSVQNFHDLCLLIRGYVVRDPELLTLHASQISDREYQDSAYHILIQDIIYATVKHFDRFATAELLSVLNRLILKPVTPIPIKNTTNLTAHQT